MNLIRGVWLGCLFAICLCGEGLAAPRSEVVGLVQQISRTNLETTVNRQIAFETRFMGSDSNTAASLWLKETMEGFGYTDARLDSFKVNINRTLLGKRFILNDLTQWNVVATKPGLLYPDRQIGTAILWTATPALMVLPNDIVTNALRALPYLDATAAHS